MRIVKVVLVAFCCCLVLSNVAAAQEIELKKNFFSPYKYSIDGENYEKVGVNATGLRSLMNGNEESIAQLDAYKSKQVLSWMTGIPGGFLIGWPLGGYVGGGEWEDEYNVMLGIGIPLAILSTVFDRMAVNHLKKAVSIHNDSIKTTGIGFDLDMGYNRHIRGVGVSFVLSF